MDKENTDQQQNQIAAKPVLAYKDAENERDRKGVSESDS